MKSIHFYNTLQINVKKIGDKEELLEEFNSVSYVRQTIKLEFVKTRISAFYMKPFSLKVKKIKKIFDTHIKIIQILQQLFMYEYLCVRIQISFIAEKYILNANSIKYFHQIILYLSAYDKIRNT